MAAQLTRHRFRSLGSNISLRLSPRIVALLAAGLIVVVAISALVGISDAHDRERRALAHTADATALLALPPVSTDALRAQVAAVNTRVAQMQATPSAPVTPDDLDALLVREAQYAGLTVASVTRLADAPRTIEGKPYMLEGVRMTVDGRPEQFVGLLSSISKQDAGIIPTLNTLTIDDAGVAHVDAAFQIAAVNADATPVAGAAP